MIALSGVALRHSAQFLFVRKYGRFFAYLIDFVRAAWYNFYRQEMPQ